MVPYKSAKAEFSRPFGKAARQAIFSAPSRTYFGSPRGPRYKRCSVSKSAIDLIVNSPANSNQPKREDCKVILRGVSLADCSRGVQRLRKPAVSVCCIAILRQAIRRHDENSVRSSRFLQWVSTALPAPALLHLCTYAGALTLRSAHLDG